MALGPAKALEDFRKRASETTFRRQVRCPLENLPEHRFPQDLVSVAMLTLFGQAYGPMSTALKIDPKQPASKIRHLQVNGSAKASLANPEYEVMVRPF